MSTPNCPTCTAPMQFTDSIGARGYCCPAPGCSVVKGPQYVLSFTYAPRGARGLVQDAVCGYTILISRCQRCGLTADFGDPEEKKYHTQSGGCR